MTDTTFFAVCPPGLEAGLAAELDVFGAGKVRATGGGVEFTGSLASAYRSNLHSRLASRILRRLAQSTYRNEDDIYTMTAELPWEDLIDARQSLRVDVATARAPLRSREFATLRVKDAICDRVRARRGARPSVDREHPDIRVFAFFDAERASVYLDLSGAPLFKRGYRAEKGEAPLKENLAAGLLLLSDWGPQAALVDPFCGSGTIVIEAAMIAARRAPGLQRRFAFERLPDFDPIIWRQLQDEARDAIDERVDTLLVGTDISTRAIETARDNARKAGLSALLDRGVLRLDAGDVRAAAPPTASDAGWIVTNPPYGEQSAPKSASVSGLMRDVGDRLKSSWAGWQAWMLTADRDLPRQLRLHETRKTVLFNGPLECRLFRFEMVTGSYRPRAHGTATAASNDAAD